MSRKNRLLGEWLVIHLFNLIIDYKESPHVHNVGIMDDIIVSHG
jgi:hypothetical protein